MALLSRFLILDSSKIVGFPVIIVRGEKEVPSTGVEFFTKHAFSTAAVSLFSLHFSINLFTVALINPTALSYMPFCHKLRALAWHRAIPYRDVHPIQSWFPKMLPAPE